MPGDQEKSGMPQMPPTPDEANRDVVDFETMQLRKLELLLDPKKEWEQKKLRLHIKEKEYELTISHILKPKTEIISFLISNGSENVSLDLTFKKTSSKTESCDIYIGRTGKSLPRLPFGICMKLYQKGRQYIQERARVKNITIEDKLVQGSETDDKKWHEYFDPVIGEGYIPSGGKTWKKEYKPTP